MRTGIEGSTAWMGSRVSANLLILLTIVGAASLADDAGNVVTDPILDVEAIAPKDWIVRRMDDDGEHRMVFSRELLAGMPRFHMGLTIHSSNKLRRQVNATPSEMARGLCDLNQKSGSATTPCRATTVGRDLIVEWEVLLPSEGDNPPTVVWKKMLANDAADTLVVALFEYPQSESTQGRAVAALVMPSIKRPK